MADESAKKRELIQQIMSDPSIDDSEKPKAIQKIMLGKWADMITDEPVILKGENKWTEKAVSEEERARSWHSEEKGLLGCSHYRRGAKIRASCCGKFYACRLCHDAEEPHKVDRHATTEMMCMHCGEIQPIQQYCRNENCVPVVVRSESPSPADYEPKSFHELLQESYDAERSGSREEREEGGSGSGSNSGAATSDEKKEEESKGTKGKDENDEEEEEEEDVFVDAKSHASSEGEGEADDDTVMKPPSTTTITTKGKDKDEDKDTRTRMSWWYCDICKFFDDMPGKEIFHCPSCGICRLGAKEDYIHCDTCEMCLPKILEFNHKCIEGKTRSQCPICTEKLFESREGVQLLEACGHCIHSKCLKEWWENGNFRCPVCFKSYVDLSPYYNALEARLSMFPTPEEYKNTKAHILCNDCETKCTVPFSLFDMHKCQNESCNSFNTRILDTTGMPTPEDLRGNPLEHLTLRNRLQEAATSAQVAAAEAIQNLNNNNDSTGSDEGEEGDGEGEAGTGSGSGSMNE